MSMCHLRFYFFQSQSSAEGIQSHEGVSDLDSMDQVPVIQKLIDPEFVPLL